MQTSLIQCCTNWKCEKSQLQPTTKQYSSNNSNLASLLRFSIYNAAKIQLSSLTVNAA